MFDMYIHIRYYFSTYIKIEKKSEETDSEKRQLKSNKTGAGAHDRACEHTYQLDGGAS
jgi:hypothetical protein